MDLSEPKFDIKNRQKQANELFPLIYQSLKKRVKSHRCKLSCQDTLNTTALINEAYIKIMNSGNKEWEDQSHFLEVASLAVKQIILDYARAQTSQKRGENAKKISFDEDIDLPDNILFTGIKPEQLLALDIAIKKLSKKDERAGKIVLYRFFGNMTIEEVASTLGISTITVKRDWRFARSWLFKEIGDA